MSENSFQRLRSLCLELPEAREVEAWGAPTFRVKTIFAIYSAPDERNDRPSAWVKAEALDQDLLVNADPERFFVPPYVGVKGWVGVYLDGDATDWEHLEAMLKEAWKMSSPKRLVATHAAELGLD